MLASRFNVSRIDGDKAHCQSAAPIDKGDTVYIQVLCQNAGDTVLLRPDSFL